MWSVQQAHGARVAAAFLRRFPLRQKVTYSLQVAIQVELKCSVPARIARTIAGSRHAGRSIAPSRALFFMSRNRKMAEDVVMVRAYRAVAVIAFVSLMVLFVKGW